MMYPHEAARLASSSSSSTPANERDYYYRLISNIMSNLRHTVIPSDLLRRDPLFLTQIGAALMESNEVCISLRPRFDVFFDTVPPLPFRLFGEPHLHG